MTHYEQLVTVLLLMIIFMMMLYILLQSFGITQSCLWISCQDDPEDLHFKKGDIMIVVNKDEEEWWTVRHSDGRTGSIPVPYVEIVSASFLSCYISPLYVC